MHTLTMSQSQLLYALHEASTTGLNKAEAGRATKINPYYADLCMDALKNYGYASYRRDGRYYITDAGVARLHQLQITSIDV